MHVCPAEVEVLLTPNMDFRPPEFDPEADFSLEVVLDLSTRTLLALPELYPDEVRRTTPVVDGGFTAEAVLIGG